MPDVEIELSFEDYFTLNEEARNRNILLDDFINEILRKKMEEENDKTNGK